MFAPFFSTPFVMSPEAIERALRKQAKLLEGCNEEVRSLAITIMVGDKRYFVGERDVEVARELVAAGKTLRLPETRADFKRGVQRYSSSKGFHYREPSRFRTLLRRSLR